MLWLYEWLDLWASPLLTAWIVIAYCLAAFTLEMVFRESPFCKYVCPLGAFNFTYSMASPTQISAVDLKTCKECEGKECVNGSAQVLGCGTELFVPVLNSNMDCTLCLDCARACPYENVKLSLRKPLIELRTAPYRARWDHIFLISSLTFMGILNAFGMVPPIYTLQKWMAETLGLSSDPIRLLIIFILAVVVIPASVILVNSWIGKIIGNATGELRMLAGQYSPSLIPLGFGIWLAHYGFHFAIGGMTIIPVMHNFTLDHNFLWFGSDVNWGVGFLLPEGLIFPLQVAIVLLGFVVSLIVLANRGMGQQHGTNALGELLPWAITLMVLTVISLSIFNLPMEMRGALQ
jgi:hypothetical protein